jgi:Rrf2 family protein
MVSMAQSTSQDEYTTVPALSQRLDISKIYLEQVFSLLRRSGLVNSIKGAQGGYQLSRPATQISAYEILEATEIGLFDEPESTVKETAPGIESAMQDMLFGPVNDALKEMFGRISLADLAEEAHRQAGDGSYMYYL